MNNSNLDDLRPMGTGSAAISAMASVSAVSWGAIFAGAAAAASLSLILLILGVGLGLSSVSPWSGAGVSAATFGISTVLWITFTQLAASGIGGYLAGRLRSRWMAVHSDEVYFRDTAHGFLAWGVASIVTAALLSSAAGAIVSGGVQAGASVASGVATAGAAATAAAAPAAASAMSSSPTASSATPYFVDSLFRRDTAAAASATAAGATAAPAVPSSPGAAPSMDASQSGPVPAAEVGRIFASGLRTGAALPADDTRYVAQLVAQRTGMSQADAEKRVTDGYNKLQAQLRDAETQARDAADKARKATAYAALWIFVALLAGAFFASLAATFGGRQRDL